MGTRQFLPHIEFLRAFAIILVVYTHVYWPLGSTLDRILFTFFQNGTVVFIFISGFLFSFLNPELNFRSYLGKKLRFVILPYVILSAFFITRQVVFYRSYVPTPRLVAEMLLTGAPIQIHFWFIPMIALFFLTAPLFKTLSTRRWGIALLALTLPLSVLTWRPYGQLNPILSYIHYFGIYHFGAVAGAHRETFDRFTARRSVIAAAAAVFALSWALQLASFDTANSAVFEDLFRLDWKGPDFSMLQKLAMLLLVYGMAARFVTRRWKLTRILGEYSFGIFFLHLVFISQAMEIWKDNHNTWACLAIGSISIVCSLAVVWLLKRIAGKRSRYILGC